jgi:hypothetical protein
MEPLGPGARFVPVADIEMEAVLPARSGFRLEGRGADGAAYQLELHLDLPVDQRTRQVLGELLAQSELKISRKVGEASLASLRRERARQRE